MALTNVDTIVAEDEKLNNQLSNLTDTAQQNFIKLQLRSGLEGFGSDVGLDHVIDYPDIKTDANTDLSKYFLSACITNSTTVGNYISQMTPSNNGGSLRYTITLGNAKLAGETLNIRHKLEEAGF